jgi:hypothetical protein
MTEILQGADQFYFRWFPILHSAPVNIAQHSERLERVGLAHSFPRHRKRTALDGQHFELCLRCSYSFFVTILLCKGLS